MDEGFNMTRGLTAFLLAFFLLNNAIAQDAPKKTVLCSTTQIADFARQIVGDRWQVWCVLAPGADPHTYQPTPRDAEMALKADLCLQNGLNLEGHNWMGNLAKDANKPLAICTLGIQPLELEIGGEKMNDPHSWFTPANAAVYVRNILKAVSEIDAGGRPQFEARAQLYLQQLRTLDAWIRMQFHEIALPQRILVTSHDAFNYFAQAYGFKNIAPVGWSTGGEVGAGMTPERRASVVDSIRDQGVKAIFVETSTNPKLLRDISIDAGVRIGGSLYSDSMGEMGSAGETYIGMMRENVLTIITALR